MRFYLIFSLLFILSSAQAENKTYITNALTIPMLKEKNIDAAVIFEIPITAEIQVISQALEGWSEILYNKKKGWIESRYLSTQPNNAVALKNLESEFLIFKREMLAIEHENEYLRQQQEKSSQELKDSQRQNRILLHKANSYQKLAKNPLLTEAKNKDLRQKMAVLKIENDLLHHTEELKRESKQLNWIALLVVCCILCLILGLFMGSYISTRPKPLNSE